MSERQYMTMSAPASGPLSLVCGKPSCDVFPAGGDNVLACGDHSIVSVPANKRILLLLGALRRSTHICSVKTVRS